MFPSSVQHHTRLVLLDTLGVILAGAERPEVRQLRERLAAGSGAGATVYARGWPSCDPRTAALLNGIAGRSIELCEGLRLVSGQAAMQVLPGVLAVGEQAGSTGRDMLMALLLGYDVAARLAMGSRRGHWRIRTVRCRCWRRPRREHACAVSMRLGSAEPCVSRQRWC